MLVTIEENTYKKIKYTIQFCSGSSLDWGTMKDKFVVSGDFNWSKCHEYKNIDDLRREIKKDIDDWYSQQPKTNEDWVGLVSDCVIQDGYEDWHIDEVLIMEVLKKYAKLNVKA